MPYPKKRLQVGEQIKLDVHPHPLFFFGPVALLVVGIAAAVASMAMLDGTAQRAANNIDLVVLAAGLCWLTVRYIRWRNTFFVVTTQRVISQSGVLSRTGIEIPIERVNTVSYRQSLLARAVGVGDIEIESGGEEGRQEFPDIRDPGSVKNVISAQIRAGRDAAHRPVDTLGVADITVQLERLEAMLDRGTLTWAEFEQQKRKLLAYPGDT